MGLREMKIDQVPSPNFGPRKEGALPSLVVLHYTAMETAQAALERLCDPMYEVSAHYLITRTGQVWQLVDEQHRAWHAGAGEWTGVRDVNSHSIGIELDNSSQHPFPEPQMCALERLLHQIMQRWDIPPEGVIGHSDLAPGRKVDPGPRFDWQRLALGGLARPAGGREQAQGADYRVLRTKAKALGYTAAMTDEVLLNTLRLRYRPWGQGALCGADIKALPSGD